MNETHEPARQRFFECPRGPLHPQMYDMQDRVHATFSGESNKKRTHGPTSFFYCAVLLYSGDQKKKKKTKMPIYI